MVVAAVIAAWPAVAPAAQPSVVVQDAWVRATVPGQKVAGAYLTIRSAKAGKLIGVASPVAKSGELHSMSNAGGVMRMRHLDSVALPAGKDVTLEPNGTHIMLLDITQQLNAGQEVPLTLTVKQGGHKQKIEVKAQVREVK
jgi:copper(I)-binding protein